MDSRFFPARQLFFFIVVCGLFGISLPAWAVQWRPLAPADLAATPTTAGQPLVLRAQVAPSGANFEFRRRLVTPKGVEHWRYQQTWQGLPVWGEYVDVHRRGAQGNVVRGRVAIDMPTNVVTKSASLSSTRLLSNLQDEFVRTHAFVKAQWKFSDARADYVWFVDKNRAVRAYAVYFRAQANGVEPVRFNAIVDATTGVVLKKWNGLTHADANGPGGNAKTGRYVYGTDLPALDVTEEGSRCIMANENVTTINLNHAFSDVPHQFDCPENTVKEINGAFSPLNDAHFFGNATYKMFREWIGTPPLSFDLTLRVHYETNYENAFWDGSTMTFGDGADTFYPLVDANVVSHEVAHGFTEQNSNLIYQGQSGGINESYSDMAGEALEQFVFGEVDWLMGGSILKAPEGALRYFEQPSRDGISIDYANQYYEGMDVHHSSGVFNRAFFLLATSRGWDVRQAFELFTYANRYYWQPNSTFVSAACDSIMAANELDLRWQDVNDAFVAVGVICTDLPTDTDTDGMPDSWEILYGLNPNNAADAALDGDRDTLRNLLEFRYRTNPNDADSDDDDLSDAAEINVHLTRPNSADTDEDQMPDGWEVRYSLNALDGRDAVLDRDGDGTSNLNEYKLGSNPMDPNSRPTPVSAYFESFESGNLGVWAPEPGFAEWYVSEDFAGAGARSLRSAVVEYGHSSRMEWLQYTTDGELHLTAGVSTEAGYVNLQIYIDDRLYWELSGTQQQQFSIVLAAGVHKVSVQYSSGAILNSNANAAWIDNIEFIGYLDSDRDGLYDGWEITRGLDPHNAADALLDRDADQLNNLQEYLRNTDIDNPDTDGDELIDGREVALGADPRDSDTDNDGMPDGWEQRFGLQLLNVDADLDADRDGINNLDEYLFDCLPNDPASRPQPVFQFFESFEQQIADRWMSIEGSVPWAVSDRFASDGRYSLRSGSIGDDGTSRMHLPLLIENGVLSFDVGVDSEPGFDFVRVFIDDEPVVFLSGFQQQRITRLLQAGRHELRVEYSKDLSKEFGGDAGWIDNIQFRPIVDTDKDGLYDEWELVNGLNPNNAQDAGQDRDGDGLTNLDEFNRNTDIDQVDTDGDTLVDGIEVHLGLDPLNSDSDGDHMTDGWEVQYELDPLNDNDGYEDFDSDGLYNLNESQWGTHPRMADTDSDGLADNFEVENYFNPVNVDTDYDLMPDGWEFEHELMVLGPDFDLDKDLDGFSNGREYFLDSSPNNANVIPQLKHAYYFSFEEGNTGKWFASTYTTPWQVAQSFASHGQFSLRSGAVVEGSISEMNVLLYTHEGRLRLDAGVDSELLNDTFSLWVDGELHTELSGTKTQRVEVLLSEGLHQLTVRYQKNEGTTSGADVAWIDNIRFISNAADVDADYLLDAWEQENGLDPSNREDALQDSDTDGLNNTSEFERGTHPRNADTDNDGLPDGVEVTYALNPLSPDDAVLDLDGDGVNNRDEYRNGTDLAVPDRQSNGGSSFAGGGGGGGGSLGVLFLFVLLGLYGYRYRKGAMRSRIN